MSNTKPSTPFGHFFDSIGIWEPTADKAILKLYNKLTIAEKEASERTSGIMAIVTRAEKQVPDIVYTAIQTRFPDITRENVAGWINKVLELAGQVNEASDFSMDYALQRLGTWLGGFEGNEWAIKVNYVANLLAMVIAPAETPIQRIMAIMEYVYQGKVKTWVDKLLESIFNKQ